MDTLEDDVAREVDLHRVLGKPQQPDVAAVAAHAERGTHAVGVSAHLAHHVGAVAVREVDDPRLHLPARRIEAVVRTHPRREFPPPPVRLDRDDSGSSRRARDPDGEQADRTAADHRDDPTRHLRVQNSVESVAERVEHRRQIVVDGIGDVDDVRRRDGDVLGEGAVPVDADDPGVPAHVRLLGAAVLAVPADQVSFRRDAVADLDVPDQPAGLDDFSHEFVAEDDRRIHPVLRPAVPLVNVEIRAADPRPSHLYQHVARANLGHRRVAHHEAGGRPGFADRFHGGGRWLLDGDVSGGAQCAGGSDRAASAGNPERRRSVRCLGGEPLTAA